MVWAADPDAPTALAQPPAAANRTQDTAAGVLIFDAGHGGKDTGAHGPAGATEKQVCLALAQQLALLLENTYRIVLTRTADYGLELSQRTALANQNRGDLLISLHTGASFLHATRGLAIYTLAPTEERNPAGGNDPSQLWDHLQLRHLSASRNLAMALQQTLTPLADGAPVQMRQAPLTVLQGADMPAVMVEFAYLTHPATEQLLTSEDGLRLYAKAIARAIDAFMATAHRPQ